MNSELFLLNLQIIQRLLKSLNKQPAGKFLTGIICVVTRAETKLIAENLEIMNSNIFAKLIVRFYKQP